MAYIPIDDIVNRKDSIYKLAVLAAKRAAELNAGAPRLIDAPMNMKVTTLALEEIRQGKITYKIIDDKSAKKPMQ